MLADSLLPIPFLAEAVNTGCYVQNRVLVTKPHNKTPYELLLGRTPSIGFMRPFGCPVTILNTLDPLGKFDGKADEGFLVGYSVSSKALRVFNSRTRIVQETLHINFLQNQPNVAGSTYVKEAAFVQQYVLLPLWSTGFKDPQNTDVDATFDVKEPESEVHVSLSSSDKIKKHDEKTKREAKGKKNLHLWILLKKPNDPNKPALEDIIYSDDEEDVGVEADFSNLETNGKSASTPIDNKKPLLKYPDGKDVDVHIYESMIGLLMYLTSSRPDIMFAVCACACFQVAPKDSHLHAIKRIFRYLKGKPYLVLWYPEDSPFNLVAYSDSDYAGESFDRKSTTGERNTLDCVFLGFGLTMQTSISIKKNNDVMRLQALIDRKMVIITEDTIRQALRLDDADGVDCLPNEEFFVELARMGYEKPSTKLTFYKAFFSAQWNFLIHTILQCMSAKRTAWNEFISSMASSVIYLATGYKHVVMNVRDSWKQILHPNPLKIIIQSSANINKRPIAEFVQFINPHQPVLLIFVLIDESSWIGVCNIIIVSTHRYPIKVLVIMPLDNLEFSDTDDSTLRVDIASRLPVDSKTVELLTFAPPMGDSLESTLVVAYRFLNLHCPRHQVFNLLDVPLVKSYSNHDLELVVSFVEKTIQDAEKVLQLVDHQHLFQTLDVRALPSHGVTTNSDESNGVEADVSNIETTITASPTPTLRIHKDHPKEPKKIFNALQDPSWVEAMQEELLQFKIQKVWSLVDYPKG
nr:uncharacterized mitochondrial protein AtMg00810-like [Tanacetum cinerariifolium]